MDQRASSVQSSSQEGRELSSPSFFSFQFALQSLRHEGVTRFVQASTAGGYARTLLLDEVDAFLDVANQERIGKLLKVDASRDAVFSEVAISRVSAAVAIKSSASRTTLSSNAAAKDSSR